VKLSGRSSGTYGEGEKCIRILVRIAAVKTPLGRTSCRRQFNIRIDLKERKCAFYPTERITVSSRRICYL